MRVHRIVVLTAVLALVSGAAAAQQSIQTSPQTPSTAAPMTTPMAPAQPPMGRPEPESSAVTPGAAPQAMKDMACPMCEMGAKGEPGKMMEMHMRQAAIPEETITRAQALMNAEIHPADPQSLLAMKDTLNLTEDQAAQLRGIVDSAQERALGVLDSNQWAKVRELKPQAVSMVEMHRNIMPTMMRSMGQMRQPGAGAMPYGRPEAGSAQPQGSGCPMKP